MNDTTNSAQGDENKKDIIPLTPTLVIGLGGSGKEVLLRLRRLFYEKYGAVGMSAIEYMWFDTDKNDLLAGDRDVINAKVQLGETDIVDARIPESVCKDIVKDMATSYQHIAEWYNKSALKGVLVEGMSDGAKQIRPLGRLATFYHVADIKKTMSTKLRKLKEGVEEAKRFYEKRGNVEYQITPNKLNIVICGSIAGGTGSGSFLDMGFLARIVAKEGSFSTAQIKNTGIFFLPSVFEGILTSAEMERVRANGYGALLELNYYLYPRTRYTTEEKDSNYLFQFECAYQANNVKELVDQPYNMVYLLDGENEKSCVPHQHSDTFQMVSEFLFLDFSESTFINKLASLHSNTDNALGTEEPITHTISGIPFQSLFSNCFSVFGLSQIRVNVDRIKIAAATKLQKDIFSLLIQDISVSPGWFKEADFVRYGLLEANLYQNMQRKNEKELFTDFYKDLWNAPFKEENSGGVKEYLGIEDLRTTILARKEDALKSNMEATIMTFISEINASLNRVLDKYSEDMAEGFTNGEIVVKIEENKKRVQKEITAAIDEELIMDLYHIEARGVTYAKARIDRITNHIKKLITINNKILNRETYKPESLKTGIDSIEMASVNTKEVEQYKRLLNEAHSLLSFIPPLFKSTAVNYCSERLNSAKENAVMMTKKSEKQFVSTMYDNLLTTLNKKEEEVFAYLQNEITKRVGREMSDMLKNILQHIENGWNAKLDGYVATIDDVVEQDKDQFEALNSPVLSKRNIELSAGWNEGDYEKEMKQEESQYSKFLIRKLRAYYEVFQKDFKLSSSQDVVREIVVRAEARQRNSGPWKKIVAHMRDYAFSEFKNFKPKSIVSAAEHFYQSEPDVGKRKEKMASCLKASAPWFRASSEFERKYKQQIADTAQGKRSILLFGSRNEDMVELKNTIEGGSDYQSENFTPETILFFTEYVGIAAFAFNEVKTMRKAYLNVLRRNPDDIFKHHLEMDIDKYPEILPTDVEELKEMSGIVKPIIKAILQGLISFDSQQKAFFLSGRNADTGSIKNTKLKSTIMTSASFFVGQARETVSLVKKTTDVLMNLSNEQTIQMSILLQGIFEQKGNKLPGVVSFYAQQLYNEIVVDLWTKLGVQDARKVFEAKDHYKNIESPEIKKFFADKDEWTGKIHEFAERVEYRDQYISDGFSVFKSGSINLKI